MRRPTAVAAAGILACLVAGPSSAASTAEVRVELHENQRATVVGQGTSVRAVVEELCWRSGVAFQYDDGDAAFGIAAENEPLETVLASLLRGKSYLLRMRRTGNAPPSVAALHVLGPDGTGRRTHAAPASPPRFVVPFQLVEAAFAGGPSEGREAAIRNLAQSVSADPERRQAFLATDPAVIKLSLRRYPEAVAVIRRMEALASEDPVVRTKLGSIVAALESPDGDASTVAAAD